MWEKEVDSSLTEEFLFTTLVSLASNDDHENKTNNDPLNFMLLASKYSKSGADGSTSYGQRRLPYQGLSNAEPKPRRVEPNGSNLFQLPQSDHEGPSVWPEEIKSAEHSTDIKVKVKHLFVYYLIGSGDFGWPPLLCHDKIKGQTPMQGIEDCRTLPPTTTVHCCALNCRRSLQEVRTMLAEPCLLATNAKASHGWRRWRKSISKTMTHAKTTRPQDLALTTTAITTPQQQPATTIVHTTQVTDAPLFVQPDKCDTSHSQNQQNKENKKENITTQLLS